MNSLIRKCAQSTLNCAEIKSHLGAIDFWRDILPRIHGPRHDVRRLRALLNKRNALNPLDIGAQCESREIFHYLGETSHAQDDQVDHPKKHGVSLGYARNSLFHLGEYRNTQPPSIGILDFLDSKHCTVVGFCLPPFACLPLHDHPAMDVLMKIVFGDVWLTSFDPVHSGYKGVASGTLNGSPLARLVHNSVITCQSEVSSVTPPGTGGYYHHIAAGKNGGVFVDVIFPPYGTPPSYSKCTYYTVQNDENSNEPLHIDRTYQLSPAQDPCIPMHMLPFGDSVQ